MSFSHIIHLSIVTFGLGSTFLKDVSLYIGPRVDLWVLQDFTITGRNWSFWSLVWLSNSRVVNDTQGFTGGTEARPTDIL